MSVADNHLNDLEPDQSGGAVLGNKPLMQSALGCRWTGQNPPVMETLLHWHASGFGATPRWYDRSEADDIVPSFCIPFLPYNTLDPLSTASFVIGDHGHTRRVLYSSLILEIEIV